MSVTDNRIAGAKDAQVLIEEARRRQRRRYVVFGATTLVLAAGIALAGLSLTGTQKPIPPTGLGRAATPTVVRKVTFEGRFVPEHVVAVGTELWLLGTTEPGNGCAVEEVDPNTLQSRPAHPLPECGTYVAVGGSTIYIDAMSPTAIPDSFNVHVETFDTATLATSVFGPVVTTTAQGDSYAHMAMVFGNGTLWFEPPWASTVFDVSPRTGAVLSTVTGGPTPDGGHLAMAANAGGLWLAPGVGGPAVIERLAPGSTTPRPVYRASTPGEVLWLSAVEKEVWAEVVNVLSNGTQAKARLVAFDASGKKV